MGGSARSDPRLMLIAAVLAVGETPEGLALCERFVTEIAKLERGAAHSTPPNVSLPPGVSAAIDGIAMGLAIAADHAEYLSQVATSITPPAPAQPAR